ncbi:MAG: MjaI family restriction endonuclease [Candidatus Poribacteria bacterium]|nr:MjaI family restriction endonuclease [Candidatus Poribacteria bacterium]
MRIKLKNTEIQEYVNAPASAFPKYTTQLMNVANQNSQATRPKHVGQLSDLIQEFPEQTFEEWVTWYQDRYPDAIDEATEKIISMVENFNEAVEKIDRTMVKSWVADLILVKTFIGLRFQEAILKTLAEIKGCDYRLAEPDEESQGIDGFVGEEAYSIKPNTYDAIPTLAESIEVKMIFYEKKKDGVVFEIPEE